MLRSARRGTPPQGCGGVCLVGGGGWWWMRVLGRAYRVDRVDGVDGADRVPYT